MHSKRKLLSNFALQQSYNVSLMLMGVLNIHRNSLSQHFDCGIQFLTRV